MAKCGVRAIGRALGAELAKLGCTGLTVTPGFLRSEAMLEHFGVTEETWRNAVGRTAPPDFAVSETPTYLGRAVAALATVSDGGLVPVVALAQRALLDAGGPRVGSRRPPACGDQGWMRRIWPCPAPKPKPWLET